MNVKAVAISSFARFMLGGAIFSRLLGIVTRQNDHALTGAEKRHAAMSEVKTIGLELSEWAG